MFTCKAILNQVIKAVMKSLPFPKKLKKQITFRFIKYNLCHKLKAIWSSGGKDSVGARETGGKKDHSDGWCEKDSHEPIMGQVSSGRQWICQGCKEKFTGPKKEVLWSLGDLFPWFHVLSRGGCIFFFYQSFPLLSKKGRVAYMMGELGRSEGACLSSFLFLFGDLPPLKAHTHCTPSWHPRGRPGDLALPNRIQGCLLGNQCCRAQKLRLPRPTSLAAETQVIFVYPPA